MKLLLEHFSADLLWILSFSFLMVSSKVCWCSSSTLFVEKLAGLAAVAELAYTLDNFILRKFWQ